jgi:hypothetical protein
MGRTLILGRGIAPEYFGVMRELASVAKLHQHIEASLPCCNLRLITDGVEAFHACGSGRSAGQQKEDAGAKRCLYVLV